MLDQLFHSSVQDHMVQEPWSPEDSRNLAYTPLLLQQWA